jgi:hypothetical protein
MRKIFVSMAVACCFALQAYAGNKALDVSQLQGRGYDAIVATTDAGELKFEDSVLTGFPGVIPHLIASAKNEKKGEEISSKYGLVDPAVALSTELARVLAERLGLSMSYSADGRDASPRMVFSMRKPNDLQRTFGAGKLVVDVRSMNWDVNLDGKERYRAGYWAKAQVVDTSTGEVLASKECIPKIKKKSEAPFVATMFDNDAAELKAEIEDAVNKCRVMFMAELVNLQTPEQAATGGVPSATERNQ